MNEAPFSADTGLFFRAWKFEAAASKNRLLNFRALPFRLPLSSSCRPRSPLSTSRVGELWFELDRPEGLNLSFLAYKEQARSVAAVKEEDEGVTA
jgi:hypothetical protein